jgi:hypothetical protein
VIPEGAGDVLEISLVRKGRISSRKARTLTVLDVEIATISTN